MSGPPSLWGWIQRKPDGTGDQLCAIVTLEHGMTPLLTETEEHAREVAPIAQDIANKSGHPVRLYQYTPAERAAMTMEPRSDQPTSSWLVTVPPELFANLKRQH